MSIRSLIGMEDSSTGHITFIYCHNDGYFEGVGKTLVTSWTDPEKIRKLLALGDISILGNVIGRKHRFDRHHYSPRAKKDYTLAYARDRGDEGCEARTVATRQAFRKEGERYNAEFLYLSQNGKWLGSRGGAFTKVNF